MQRSISNISVDYLKDSEMDAEMCNMFGSLSLKAWDGENREASTSQSINYAQAVDLQRKNSGFGLKSEESTMMEIIDGEGNIQFISSPASLKAEEPEYLGCGILNALQNHYNAHSAQATCCPPDPDFNFLDTILTHREAFVAWPYGHRTCSKALTQLAFELERRHREENQDGDLDTAIALHNEAWLMSGWYST